MNIKVFEHLGAENLLYFSVNGSNIIAKISGESFVRSGENARVSFQMEKMHLFNKKTEQRIG